MSDENEQEQQDEGREVHEGIAYLTRSAMLPIEHVVYCLDHTAVHNDTTDPYRSEDDQCRVEEHRPVYYRGRKGDLDEREHPETREGSRIIAPTLDEQLSADEMGLVVRLVRQSKGTALEAAAAIRELFGTEDSNLEELNALLARMDSILAKLGGDTDAA